MSQIEKKTFHPNCLETEEAIQKSGHVVDHPSNKHNPKCAMPKRYLSCTEEMSVVPDICRWHHARMARWIKVKCACTINNKHIACDGDSTGRCLFRSYYNSWNNMPVINMCGELWCCGESENHSSYIGKCGDMHICSIHEDDHPNIKTIDQVEEEAKVANGPVKVVTHNIVALKQGDGFNIYISHAPRSMLIKTYKDAMDVHLHFVETNDDRSFDWLVIASHMTDRPSYIKPIIVDGLVYATMAPKDDKSINESNWNTTATGCGSGRAVINVEKAKYLSDE